MLEHLAKVAAIYGSDLNRELVSVVCDGLTYTDSGVEAHK